AMNLRDGQILLLENVRFHAGETKNDDLFARQLASLAQVYVNDAFGAAHRAHASTTGVANLIEEKGAGLLLEREVKALSGLLAKPERPFICIVGGAKVAGKIGVIENLLPVCDQILIGGAMAYTFLAARGLRIGNSRVEEDKIALAKRALLKADARGVEIVLPSDHVCAPEIANDAPTKVFHNGDVIPDRLMGLDIGPETVEQYVAAINASRTVFWNGPMGVFEMPAFAQGTMQVANAIAKANTTSVVGGGDSVSAVKKAGVTPFINHISTGGGASLELMEGKELPGIEALRQSRRSLDV
ncbi:MAG: phosphoglycerate kinase, partial [Myxococcota bacterium]